ncbi:unnamed protein product [Lepeophtheirus salmonis]|uniref:(salmon louse) hypothetical protein n=1 Tax=Lepeophtheirus salmonis TaxID=72036 RepID=A0A7R8CL41_LEPSM|nr:unnamed protein product [Lepeophtheirus salmonis]CAF2849853.1 unnamed protein product [Lepeophtheirus salmonis]
MNKDVQQLTRTRIKCHTAKVTHHTLLTPPSLYANQYQNPISTWGSSLPLIIPGIQSALKEDLGFSSAEIVLATTLKLPNEFISTSMTTGPCSHRNITMKLKEGSQDLMECTHVFVRYDTVKKSLLPPYEGPFPIAQRTRKTITITRNGNPDSVPINRVKSTHTSSTTGRKQCLLTTKPAGTKKIPFGLKNATKTFPIFIEKILRDHHFVYTYIENLLIASLDEWPHEKRVAYKADNTSPTMQTTHHPQRKQFKFIF